MGPMNHGFVEAWPSNPGAGPARVAHMRRPMDTSEEAQALYVQALRRSSPEQRLASAAVMSEEVRALAEAGIRSRHPEYGRVEVRSALAEILLGAELAGRVHHGRRTAGG